MSQKIICNYSIFAKPYYVNGVQRTQGGRWNTSSTNTKLFPIISYEKLKDSNLRIIKQSGNIFKSTTHHMSKKELHSYLTRNRPYLHR